MKSISISITEHTKNIFVPYKPSLQLNTKDQASCNHAGYRNCNIVINHFRHWKRFHNGGSKRNQDYLPNCPPIQMEVTKSRKIVQHPT